MLVFSVAAGEGFEPPTFGLWARRKYSIMWTYGNVWQLYDKNKVKSLVLGAFNFRYNPMNRCTSKYTKWKQNTLTQRNS